MRRAAIGFAVTAVVVPSILAAVAHPAREARQPFEGTVAYVVSSKATSWIETLDLATGRRTRVTEPTAATELHALAWSRDGRSLAFVKATPVAGGSGVYVVGREGTRPRRVRKLKRVEARGTDELAWSYRGTALAYKHPPQGSYPTDGCADPVADLRIGITKTSAEARGTRTVTAATAGTLDNVAWAPSDDRLLYLVRHWELGHGEECDWADVELFAIGATGQGRKRLARGGISNADWSPDGKWIAFTKYEVDDSNYLVSILSVVRSDGKRERQVAIGVEGRFAWAPDSRGILAAESGELGVVEVATGRYRRLAGWQPLGSGGSPIYAVSRDAVAVDAGTRSDSDYKLVERRIALVRLRGGTPQIVTVKPRSSDLRLGYELAVTLR